MIGKLKYILAATLLMSSTASISLAETLTVPSQAGWQDAKKYVDLPNGIRMAYVEMGDSDAQPMVLIHGYSDSSRSWSTVAPYLTDRHLIAVDLRGHGSTTAPECCYSMPEMANDVVLLMNALGVEKADVAGHSLGTMVSQTIAATYPDRVETLVLLAGTTRSRTEPGGWLWDTLKNAQDPLDPNGEMITAWYERPTPIEPPELDEYSKIEAAAIPIRAWQGILNTTITTDLAGFDSLITAKTLIVAGAKDTSLDGAHQKRLREAIPAAKYIELEHAAHGLFKEFPEEVGGIVNTFLHEAD